MIFKILSLSEIDVNQWNNLNKTDYTQSIEYIKYISSKTVIPKFFLICNNNNNYLGGWAGVHIIYNRSNLFSYLKLYGSPQLLAVEDNSKIIDTLWKRIITFCESQKIVYIDNYDMIFNRNCDNDFFKKKFDIYHKYNTYKINLRQSLDQIWSNISKTVKQDIKFSESCNIYIKEELNPQAFFELSKETYQRSNKKGRALTNIIQETNYFSQYNMMTMYFAKQDLNYLASAQIVIYGGVAYYYSGGSKSDLPRGAAKQLHWNIIKILKEKGLSYYDMTGGPYINDKKSKSIQEFKRKFGGYELICYGGIKIYSSFKYNLFKIIMLLRNTITRK